MIRVSIFGSFIIEFTLLQVNSIFNDIIIFILDVDMFLWIKKVYHYRCASISIFYYNIKYSIT